MKPSILIALPAYKDVFDGDTTVSLMNLAATLTTRGIPFNVLKVDYGDISEARNFLASFFLTKTPLTHMLFVDSDMSFKPDAVQKLIAADQAVAACSYPLRRDHGPSEVVLGAGLLLIRRDALETLSGTVRKFDKHHFTKLGYDGPIYGFFDRIITDLELIQEDRAFFKRWRDLGNNVAQVDRERIGHATRTVVR